MQSSSRKIWAVHVPNYLWSSTTFLRPLFYRALHGTRVLAAYGPHVKLSPEEDEIRRKARSRTAQRLMLRKSINRARHGLEIDGMKGEERKNYIRMLDQQSALDELENLWVTSSYPEIQIWLLTV